MACPLAISISSTPPQSPSTLKPPVSLSFTSIPVPQSPGLQRTVPVALQLGLTPASPCEAMPPRSAVLSKPKSKPKLGKGCSLMDWIRLCRSKKSEFCCNDGTPRNVTEEELSRHNTKEDAWTAIRGRCLQLCMY